MCHPIVTCLYSLPTRLCIDPEFPIAEYFYINWGFVWADEAKEAENSTPSTRLERRVMVFICGDDGCREEGGCRGVYRVGGGIDCEWSGL
ncbi:hypothetical protein CEXT_717301 [Caerostris extrusa]|uniref:Uncharacterized protein n=1 Tax=Caerostris extrusa TaxID=172846 RepID=A0AAV4Y4E8_CAEEX|nr:hypothetical protein CEXT_717301 [Caerostris extrusa]